MEGMSGAALFASTHSKEEATMTLRLALQVAEEAHQDGMLNLEEYQSTVEELQTTYHKQLEGVGTKLADVQGASGEREARLLDNDEQSVQSQGLSGFDEIYKASNTERLHNARVAPDQHSEGSASSENGPPASSSPPKLSLSLATLPVQEQPDEVHASLPAENDIAPVVPAAAEALKNRPVETNFTSLSPYVSPRNTGGPPEEVAPNLSAPKDIPTLNPLPVASQTTCCEGIFKRQELNEIFFKIKVACGMEIACVLGLGITLVLLLLEEAAHLSAGIGFLMIIHVLSSAGAMFAAGARSSGGIAIALAFLLVATIGGIAASIDAAEHLASECSMKQSAFHGCSAEACPGLESCLAENEGDGACSRDDLSSADCDCIAPSTELCEAILGKLLLLLALAELIGGGVIFLLASIAFVRLEVNEGMSSFHKTYHAPLMQHVDGMDRQIEFPVMDSTRTMDDPLDARL
ncbi:hypothetical protein CYMTET_51880 [Cymbomonas tetramitiformis]|uniref:Transmembrane protein n=1 Tax=Cymbomonas tetramitiformis TaxID=36881 RepID=A0AAE0BLL0_9CHLO|nr:hypothetical protein CYMTET_51880 [Cymbomonas tetramitiformis]